MYVCMLYFRIKEKGDHVVKYNSMISSLTLPSYLQHLDRLYSLSVTSRSAHSLRREEACYLADGLILVRYGSEWVSEWVSDVTKNILLRVQMTSSTNPVCCIHWRAFGQEIDTELILAGVDSFVKGRGRASLWNRTQYIQQSILPLHAYIHPHTHTYKHIHTYTQCSVCLRLKLFG